MADKELTKAVAKKAAEAGEKLAADGGLLAFAALKKVALARAAAKSREIELVATRKHLENELDELGAGSSPNHLRVSREYVVTLRSIDFERDRIKTLADQLEKIVSEAIQGKFDFAAEVDEEELAKRPKEADLFHRDVGPEEKPSDTRPVGRPGPAKPAAPSPEMGDGVDEHLKTSVNELDLREDIKGKLIKHQFSTVQQLVAQMACEGESEADALMSVVEDSMTLAEAKAVCKAVKSFRAKHRDAMLKKDRGE